MIKLCGFYTVLMGLCLELNKRGQVCLYSGKKKETVSRNQLPGAGY